MGVVSIGGICTPHIHLYALHTPCTSVCSPYTIYSPYVMGLGGHLYTPYVLGVFWGASVHLSDISVSTDASICLSVNNSHTSCSPSLWVASLLDWMPMDVCYASCCCSFLCSVFIMSQAFTTMAMTTTPPVTVVCSGTSSLLSVVIMAPSLMGLSAASGEHDVVLPPPLTPRHSGGDVGLAIVQQQQGTCCMLYSLMASQLLGMHQVVASSTALSRGSLLLLNQLPSSHSNYMVEHTAFWAW